MTAAARQPATALAHPERGVPPDAAPTGAQRRDAFRVRMPSAHGPRLRLHPGAGQSDGGGNTAPLLLQVLDLSLTGCAVLPPTQPPLAAGAAHWHAAATLELDDALHLPLHLVVHEEVHEVVHEVVHASGPQALPSAAWRCSWVLRRPQDEPALQRWLNQAQQQQRQLQRLQAATAASGT